MLCLTVGENFPAANTFSNLPPPKKIQPPSLPPKKLTTPKLDLIQLGEILLFPMHRFRGGAAGPLFWRILQFKDLGEKHWDEHSWTCSSPYFLNWGSPFFTFWICPCLLLCWLHWSMDTCKMHNTCRKTRSSHNSFYAQEYPLLHRWWYLHRGFKLTSTNRFIVLLRRTRTSFL